MPGILSVMPVMMPSVYRFLGFRVLVHTSSGLERLLLARCASSSFLISPMQNTGMKSMTLESGTFAGRTPTNPNKLAEIGF